MGDIMGKCVKQDCTQFGQEKNIEIAMLYGYILGASVICPDCEDPLVWNGVILASAD